VGDPVLELQGVEADLSFLKPWDIEIYTGGYELRRGPEGQKFLVHHWMTHRFAFGLYLEEMQGSGPIRIYCNGNLGEPLSLTAAHVLAGAGLHHRLLQQGCGILHAAYIVYRGRGILFAAPSQVGKSTQAALWQKFAGAEICNGDRALLFRRQGIWHAGGYIGCGSSGICKNQSVPLAAIVFLSQGKENLVRPVGAKEGLHGLLPGLETYHWSVEDIDLALSLAGELAAQVPMLHLSCTPDEGAVQTLKAYLEDRQLC
jgi:hypothetical protein